MSTLFSLTEDAKGKSLTIIYGDGDIETISESHVSFKAVIEKLLSGTANDEEIRDLTRVLETMKKKLTALSERVSVDGENVYFDGDLIDGSLAELIKKMFAEGRTLDFKPLVNFLEKAKTNPSLKSVEDLYKWAKNGDLVITPDGDIIAYKTVLVDENGKSVSVHKGKAFVNGEEFEGHIPNSPGTVISMARSQVTANEFVTCAYGLHAGTHAYAQQFAKLQHNHGDSTRLILVQINPRDVESVPHDFTASKMRVARYTVVSETEERLATTTAVYTPEEIPDEAPENDFTDLNEDAKTLDTTSVRDSKGRFKKGAGSIMQRDSKGRFV